MVTEAGDAATLFALQSPQRAGDAWNQHEQDQHQWYRQRHQSRAAAQALFYRNTIVALIEGDQGRGDDDERCEHHQRGQNALRIQEMGCDQEVTQENQYQHIAVAFAFEELERGHYRQQREAGVATDDRPVLGEHADAAEQNQRDQHPFWHFPHLAQVLQHAPSQRGQDDDDDPHRQVDNMRCDREQKTETDGEYAFAAGDFLWNLAHCQVSVGCHISAARLADTHDYQSRALPAASLNPGHGRTHGRRRAGGITPAPAGRYVCARCQSPVRSRARAGAGRTSVPRFPRPVPAQP